MIGSVTFQSKSICNGLDIQCDVPERYAKRVTASDQTLSQENQLRRDIVRVIKVLGIGALSAYVPFKVLSLIPILLVMSLSQLANFRHLLPVLEVWVAISFLVVNVPCTSYIFSRLIKEFVPELNRKGLFRDALLVFEPFVLVVIVLPILAGVDMRINAVPAQLFPIPFLMLGLVRLIRLRTAMMIGALGSVMWILVAYLVA